MLGLESILSLTLTLTLILTYGSYKAPLVGYNAAGRGYPDISAAGLSYILYIGGSTYSVSGTSASSPFMAGLFSNINAKRLAGMG
jgi:hypothetical protein